jgi:hypothetical protein
MSNNSAAPNKTPVKQCFRHQTKFHSKYSMSLPFDIPPRGSSSSAIGPAQVQPPMPNLLTYQQVNDDTPPMLNINVAPGNHLTVVEDLDRRFFTMTALHTWLDDPLMKGHQVSYFLTHLSYFFNSL